MIFEFKDATAVKGDVALFGDVSFCALPGDTVAVTGDSKAQTALLLAMLGLRPLKKGWASVDGEPVTAVTGVYFRLFMAYLPNSLDFAGFSVEEVAKSQFAIKVNSDYAYSARAVKEELARLAVGEECMAKRFDEMDASTAQRAALTLVGMFERPLLLLDNPTSQQDDAGRKTVAEYIAQRRAAGLTTIVATTDPVVMAVCNKTVSL